MKNYNYFIMTGLMFLLSGILVNAAPKDNNTATTEKTSMEADKNNGSIKNCGSFWEPNHGCAAQK